MDASRMRGNPSPNVLPPIMMFDMGLCLTMQVWEHDGGDWQHCMAAPPYNRVLLDLHRCSVSRSCNRYSTRARGSYSVMAASRSQPPAPILVAGPDLCKPGMTSAGSHPATELQPGRSPR